MRRLLTAYDVAKVLQCSYRYVHILRKRGLLRGVALGGVWRFDPADVEAYVDQQKATA
jgi:excisionase family DNA binding protein